MTTNTFVQISIVSLLSALLGSHYSRFWSPNSPSDVARWECHPFLPNVFDETPPSAHHTLLRKASKDLNNMLDARFSKSDIDSLSVAVVTSAGAVFENNWGTTRGNESTGPRTTSHSTYRIASVAKVFPTLEALILEQKQALSWDDPVAKYLPKFNYRLDGFDDSYDQTSREQTPITLFHLASHMSGLGRDWPPGTVHNWPHDLAGAGPPPTNGLPFPTHDDVYAATSKHRLTSLPMYHPAYSNTGTALLGMTVVAANRAAFGPKEPTTFAELLHRDVLAPLSMNDTHFLATGDNKDSVVVPSLAPEVADQDFLDAMNPAAGQFSSLSDMIAVTRMFLNPLSPNSLITQYSMRKWLQTVHSFEEDDWTEMGMTWEIIKQHDSNGRPRKIYWKLGAMAGYHAALAIHPGTSYGIVVLLAGHYPDAAKLAYDAFEIFQPAIDGALAGVSSELYGGNWVSGDTNSTATIVVERGVVWVKSLILQGVNVLQIFGSPSGLALRSSGRRDEFRLDTGIPGYNGARHMACYPYWNGQDLWGTRENAAVNVLHFSGSGNRRALHIPSLELKMRRQ